MTGSTGKAVMQAEKKSYASMGTSILWMKRLLFTGIFIQENKLHAVYDRYNEMSSKQWLLMVICGALDTAPDLTTLGEAMGCSRQNVKKLAMQLVKNDYVRLERSEADSRALSVVITEKGRSYVRACESYGEQIHNAVFSEFSDGEIEQYYRMSIKLMNGIDHLESLFKRISEERGGKPENTEDRR